MKINIFFKASGSPTSAPDSPILETSLNQWEAINPKIAAQIAEILKDNEVTRDEIRGLFDAMVEGAILSNPEAFRKVLLSLFETRDAKIAEIKKQWLSTNQTLADFSQLITELSLKHAATMHQSKYETAIKALHDFYKSQQAGIIWETSLATENLSQWVA